MDRMLPSLCSKSEGSSAWRKKRGAPGSEDNRNEVSLELNFNDSLRIDTAEIQSFLFRQRQFIFSVSQLMFYPSVTTGSGLALFIRGLAHVGREQCGHHENPIKFFHIIAFPRSFLRMVSSWSR
jgi:hypothetical protein